MLKKLLSYFVPVNIETKSSAYCQSLEITWNNGELVLDSKNTNYSYGSLQRILRKGLRRIGYDNIRPMDQVLVLGVAAGSVIRTLVDEVGYKGKITGVDIDAVVIGIANRHFKLYEVPNLTIVIDDAFEFVLKTRERYGLIIIDIFQDTTMPNFLFESFFIKRIAALLQPEGFILFNTMLLDAPANDRNAAYIAELGTLGFSTTVMPRVEQHNELIIAQKIL